MLEICTSGSVGGLGGRPPRPTWPFIFGYYFLIPFLFAVTVLLLEIGVVENHATVRHLALAMPGILAILASSGHRSEVVYLAFLDEFAEAMGGTPLYVTLVASLGFFAYAWWRRVAMASLGVSAVLLALACVGPATRDLSGLISPRPLPLSCLGVLELALGWFRRSSWRCLMGSVFLVAAVFAAEGGGVPALYRTAANYHVFLLSVLLLGAVFDDALGRWLRIAGSVLAVLGCLTVLAPAGASSTVWVPTWVSWVYPLAMCLFLSAYGRLVASPAAVSAAGLILALWLVRTAWRGYESIQRLVPGFNYIALGIVSFVLAWLTSLAKAGRISWATLSRGEMIPRIEQAESSNG